MRNRGVNLRRHPWLTVFLVLCLVELAIGQDLGHVERLASIRERMITVDWHVRGEPAVGEPNCRAHRNGYEQTGKLVHDRECRDGKWDEPNGKDVPIKSRKRVQAQTTQRRGDGRQSDIVGCDPGHPRKVRESLEDESGEEEVSVRQHSRA